MHIIFACRGQKAQQETFINGLNAMMLPFPNKLKDLMGNEKAFTHVQVLVQPIQLYSVVFPKEHYDLMATTIFGPDPKGQRKGFLQDTCIYGARLAMGLDPIKDYKQNNMIPIVRNGVETIGIGIKEDGVLNDGTTEAL